MRAPEILRTPTFRLAGIASCAFVLGILVLFVFIYWQTELHERRSIDRFVELKIGGLKAADAEGLVRKVVEAGAASEERTSYAAIFSQTGAVQAGNIVQIPRALPIDARAHEISIVTEPRGTLQTVHAAAAMLPDRRIVVIARSLGELRELERVVRRALMLGVIPALILALVAGALLSSRELRRVRNLDRAAARILQGELRERLPVKQSGDDLDRLAMAVNRMLDEIERLLDEVKGVGNSIAHDLRTPLTRVRARLERGRESPRSRDELEIAIDGAVAGLDQTMDIVTALLRITEIEEGSRRAAFGEVDLAHIVRDVAELYGPIAEDAGIELAVAAAALHPVKGDRDLLVEAVANVLDNAIKFAPKHSCIDLAVLDGLDGPIVRVRDRGPGIPPEERQQVLRRFYRTDRSRHLPGSGLGLGVVSAVMNLHGFRIVIGDAEPGCVFDLICAPPRSKIKIKNRSLFPMG